MPTDDPALRALLHDIVLIVKGFETEAMNGVICTPSSSEYGGVQWEAKPSRLWCARCRARWQRLRELPARIEALLAAESRSVPREPEGSWPAHCEQRAFVDGAKWWEWHSTPEMTMWPSDVNLAEAEAVKRYGDPLAASRREDPQHGLSQIHHGDPCHVGDVLAGPEDGTNDGM